MSWEPTVSIEDQHRRSPDGYLCLVYISSTEIAAGTNGKNIHIWNTDGKYIRCLEGPTHSVSAIACDDKRKALLAASDDKAVHVWNASYTHVGKLPTRATATTLAMIDNDFLLSSGAASNVQKFDLEAQRAVNEVYVQCTNLCSCTDKIFAAIPRSNDEIMLYDNNLQRITRFKLNHQAMPHKIVKIHGEYNFALSMRNIIALFDIRKLSSNNALTYDKINAHIGCIKLLANCGSYLLSSSVNTIKIWDIKNCYVRNDTISAPFDSIMQLAANQDGSNIAAVIAGHPGAIQLWSLRR